MPPCRRIRCGFIGLHRGNKAVKVYLEDYAVQEYGATLGELDKFAQAATGSWMWIGRLAGSSRLRER